ncbi:MAG TPA: hypothetical protein EYO79_02560, partial [Candidatus Marinimicrobia bacterium]|nr:hypothetical protein [Candidatus Neomarinimicrobiota bacterium]
MRSNSPYGGQDALRLHNTTISGPSGYGYLCTWCSPVIWSWSSSNTLLDTYGFGRQNGEVDLDNVTLQNANQISLNNRESYSSGWRVVNLLLDNLSYVNFDDDRFNDWCRGSFNGNVTVVDSNVYISDAGYQSTSSEPSYCHNREGSSDGWSFENSRVVIQSSGGAYWGTSSSNPIRSSGMTFVDTEVHLYGSSSMQYPTRLVDATFSATSSPSNQGTMYLSHARSGYFVTAASSSYGKWTVENNSFTPSNGWNNLDYTYSVGHMLAPYNWWGSASTNSIDANISDMLDNNGGGWANYSPFWTSAAMTQLDWNGTSPANIPLGRELSGTLFFNKTMTLNNSPYYLVGPWTIAPNVRITIDPGVQVLTNTTNSSLTVHGEIWSLGTSSSRVYI